MIPQIALFLLVGGGSALLQLISFTLLFHLTQASFGSMTASYVLSVVCHFAGNRWLTFARVGRPDLREIGRYTILVAINYLMTTATFAALNICGVPPHASLLGAIGATTLFGYFVSRNWVFERSEFLAALDRKGT